MKEQWSREDRIVTIKLRLFHALKEYKITTIKSKILADTGIDCNLTTLNNTIDTSDKSINTFCVIGICQAYHLNIAAVLSAPRIDLRDEKTLEIKESNYDPAKDVDIRLYPEEINEQTVSYEKDSALVYETLNDRHYYNVDPNGKIIPYYGYMYSANPKNLLPVSFEMTLSPEGAHLRIKNLSVNADGSSSYDMVDYYGNPVLVKRKNQIHIVFKNDLGSSYLFNFSYTMYATQHMYYRKGCIITQGRDSSRYPLMQSFVIFNRPVSEENMCYIPGLLRLCNDAFYLSASALDKVKEDQHVKILWDEYGKFIELSAEKMYQVNEAQIMKDTNITTGSIDKQNILKALQILKSVSVSPTRLYFPEDRDYADFSKSLTETRTKDLTQSYY